MLKLRRKLPRQGGGAKIEANRDRIDPDDEHAGNLSAAVFEVGSGAEAGEEAVRGGEGVRGGGDTGDGVHARAAGLVPVPELAVPPGDAVAEVPLRRLRHDALRRGDVDGGLVLDELLPEALPSGP